MALFLSALPVFQQPPAANAQPTIIEPKFVSPGYGYSISWQSPWFLADIEISGGFESVAVSDGASQVSFVASHLGGYEPVELLNEVADTYDDFPAMSELTTMRDANGAEMLGSGQNFAYQYTRYTVALASGESIESVAYFEVRMLPDGTELVILAEAEVSMFTRYQGLWPRVFSWVDIQGSPNNGTDQAAAAALDSAGVEFIIDPGVGEEDAETVTEGIRLAQALIESEFGVTIEDRLYVTAMPIESPSNPNLGGLSYRSGIVLYTGSVGWTTAVTPLERIGIVVHEFIHAYQQWASMGFNAGSPAWFEEGLAEYLSVMAMAQLQTSDSSDIDALFDHILWMSTPPPALAQLESLSAFSSYDGSVYPLSYFAVDHLLAYTGTGVAGVATYYSHLRDGLTFEAAFQAAFGVSTMQFYAEFDRVQGALGSVPAPPDDFTLLQGVRTPSEVSFSIAPTVLERDQQFLFVANTAPGVVCRLRIVPEAADGSLVDRSTFANGSGELFWLVTIPSDAPLGAGMLSASCGSLRDRVEIQIAG
jgi:hypothetical protein